MREKGRKKRLVCYIVPIFCVGRSWDFLPTYVVWFIDSITNQLGTSLLLQHTHTYTPNTNTNVENSLKEFNWFVTSLQLHFINNNYTYKFAYIQPARSSFLKITYVRGEYSVGIYGNGMNTTTNVQFFPPFSCMDKKRVFHVSAIYELRPGYKTKLDWKTCTSILSMF